MHTFSLKLNPESPPIYRTLEQTTSPAARLALSNAVNVLTGILSMDPMWEYIRTEREEGRAVPDIESMVKARAFDILIAHSGDMAENEHMNASFMLAATHYAVERVVGESRRLGLIL